MSKLTYYHGTDEESADRILKEGMHPLSEDKSRTWPKGDPTRFAFLSSDKNTAVAFAPGGRYRPNDDRKPVVLKVSPPKSISRNFIVNAGEHVRAPNHIPARYISRDDS